MPIQHKNSFSTMLTPPPASRGMDNLRLSDVYKRSDSCQLQDRKLKDCTEKGARLLG